MRYLAFDIGERRTGAAAGDDIVRLVQPLEVIDAPRGPRLIESIERLVRDHAPDALVVGLPLNMDGTEGPAATAMRGFAQAVGERLGLAVHLQDERLTSAEAEARMARSGRTRAEKKALRDALAAAAILEEFLRSGGRPAESHPR